MRPTKKQILALEGLPTTDLSWYADWVGVCNTHPRAGCSPCACPRSLDIAALLHGICNVHHLQLLCCNPLLDIAAPLHGLYNVHHFELPCCSLLLDIAALLHGLCNVHHFELP